MIVDVKPPRRTRFFQAALIGSVVLHGVAWAALTSFGQHSVTESYIVQVIINEKPPQPTPDEKKLKELTRKLNEATPPPEEEKSIKEVVKEKPPEIKPIAVFNTTREKPTTEIVSIGKMDRSLTSNSNEPMIANLNTGRKGAGAGADGPEAKMIAIGSGRKGGIGISSSGEGSISVNIGSGLGGGRGSGKGSGTGDGPDVANVFLGGVGTGRGGGGGGGGGGGIQVGSIGGGGGRAKSSGPPPVAVAPIAKKEAAPTGPSVSGEWVVTAVAGPIASLQLKCHNNPGVHIYGDIKIQCANNVIVAAWRRQ
ncbi:MAG: hypothetical protein IT350_18360 [Deltaproteobacteria bacterium]|nr:hypothetical protein [Deltaproteobacteria bacterium]